MLCFFSQYIYFKYGYFIILCVRCRKICRWNMSTIRKCPTNQRNMLHDRKMVLRTRTTMLFRITTKQYSFNLSARLSFHDAGRKITLPLNISPQSRSNSCSSVWHGTLVIRDIRWIIITQIDVQSDTSLLYSARYIYRLCISPDNERVMK